MGTVTDNTGAAPRQTTYAYDDAGRLTRTVYPNTVCTDYTYDAADRLTSVFNRRMAAPPTCSPSDTTISKFEYPLIDAVGNRKQMVDLTGTHSYDYDALYRLKQAGYPGGPTDTYTYDANGNRQTKNSITYQYDAADQMTWDGSRSYGYDNNGNQRDRGSDVFTYDHRDRLLSVTGPTASTFAYDTIGNITSKREGEALGTPPEGGSLCANGTDDDGDYKINDGCTTSYSSLNYACSPACSPARPHAVKTATGSDGSHAFTYDAAGNMTRETLNGADLRLYEYDAEGRLSKAQHEPAGPFTYYHYSADGELARKTTDPNQTGTVYIGGIFEKNTATGEVTKYYFAGGQRVAMRKYTLPDTTGQVHYFANDHLDGTAVVMDAAGNLVSRTRYYPFGQHWTQEGSTPTDKLFTGHQRESNPGGTYYAGARFYSADIGRFLSADTIVPDAGNPQELNRYSYVTNNPTNYSDPTGHFGGGVMPGPDIGGGAPEPPKSPIEEALEIVGLENPTWEQCVFAGGCEEAWDIWTSKTIWAMETLYYAGLDLNLIPWSFQQRVQVASLTAGGWFGKPFYIGMGVDMPRANRMIDYYSGAILGAGLASLLPAGQQASFWPAYAKQLASAVDTGKLWKLFRGDLDQLNLGRWRVGLVSWIESTKYPGAIKSVITVTNTRTGVFVQGQLFWRMGVTPGGVPYIFPIFDRRHPHPYRPLGPQ